MTGRLLYKIINNNNDNNNNIVHVISAVEKYSQINSEVGRSRAWLRLALNDGLLVMFIFIPRDQELRKL